MILIVDDEANHRHMLKLHLNDAGYECGEANNGAVAIAELGDAGYKLILLDITMDVMDGLTFLSYIREQGNDIPVIIITADSEAKTAVSAMKLGAADYITKPVDINELLIIVKSIMEGEGDNNRTAKSSDANASSYAATDYKFSGVYSEDGLGKIVNLLKMVAPTDATVLILGESGTGKELVARSIHENSSRAGKPFIAVNAAALNENLIESELYGHVKGAFTNATSDRRGRFEEADGGTLFLDEIGELPLSTQVSLLRFLQEKTFEPVGSSKTMSSDVRIVTATNRDLEAMILQKTFRNDLYFRLAVFPVELPPLRSRFTELPVLIDHFVKKHSEAFNKKITKVSKEYIDKLKEYSFPGNIRELENIVERSIILAQGEELTANLLPQLSNESVLGSSLKDNEVQLIKDALKECNNNKTKAAERLGISRRGLYNKLEEHSIE